MDDRLLALLRAFFLEARREQQAAGLEKKGSEKKPATQIPHPYDRMIDTICRDLGLPNPGTDEHSSNIWPHVIDGWPPEVAERMRRERIRQGMERGRAEDAAWLVEEGLRLTKDGWVRRREESYGG